MNESRELSYLSLLARNRAFINHKLMYWTNTVEIFCPQSGIFYFSNCFYFFIFFECGRDNSEIFFSFAEGMSCDIGLYK